MGSRSKTQFSARHCINRWSLQSRFILTSLLRARIGTRIMFDDYLDRPRYFVVERFCSIEMMHGRMAVFTAARDFNVLDICDAICEFSVLPDS